MKNDLFSDIMESLYTHGRIVSSYQTTPRTYGTEDLLYQTDVHAMQAIEHYPGMNLNELAEKTFRTKSAMSVLIKSLVEKGLVKRVRDKDDNRRYIISLTEKGKQIHEFHEKLDEHNYKGILTDMRSKNEITIEDLQSTLKVLETLNIVMHKDLSTTKE